MEEKGAVKITLWKQSSLAPDRHKDGIEREFSVDFSDIDPTFRLMCFANEGDVEGLKELLDSEVDVNFKDIDDRTALHIAACQGWPEIISLLIQHGAAIDAKDRWGSTPLADAIHYKNYDVVKILESKGAKPLTAPMHVKHAREVPEYEIKQTELDFANSVDLDKGTFTVAQWHGTKVAVKRLAENVTTDEEKVGAFRDELELLVKIRHPNVVQFLGAVTQTSPMMIVTEYLPKGDLRQYLKSKGALEPVKAIVFALDIARGMNYLHELKPAVIHRDLEPSNILKDDTGHLKVADFGVSKLLTVKSRRPLTCQDASCRYVAPEVFRDGEYDTKVDVFSFALILHEMIEGHQPFSVKNDKQVLKAYVARERPPFTAPSKHYSHGLKELIEACWHENPSKRPTFKEIIVKLEHIHYSLTHKSRWKVRPMKCFNNFEAMLKRDNSDLSRSSSTRSTNSI